ncbi:hypothetical protein K353_05718 [Kitasatospora sp. SolWspMP-SS2h]|uniref:hypothetical protein n=1 Tax=Kitasatospora sp. SolWspMP-SS2h TaxID=1305729 RepID=UPI000DBA8FFB|nr:hypothetical protein [Kitasatospora sp. SolWspMP-SS2h]RAJ33199.1 hypothetical protein K353_05718 [Kitasatospora sp. SolWspMP-SS2h]
MHINWTALGQVALVGIGATTALVCLFATGLRAADRAAAAPAPRRPPLRLAAGLCFLACLTATAYGLYLIVPAFH